MLSQETKLLREVYDALMAERHLSPSSSRLRVPLLRLTPRVGGGSTILGVEHREHLEHEKPDFFAPRLRGGLFFGLHPVIQSQGSAYRSKLFDAILSFVYSMRELCAKDSSRLERAFSPFVFRRQVVGRWPRLGWRWAFGLGGMMPAVTRLVKILSRRPRLMRSRGPTAEQLCHLVG